MELIEIILTRKGEGRTSLQYNGEDVLLSMGVENLDDNIIAHDSCNLYVEGELAVIDRAQVIFSRKDRIKKVER